MMFRAEMRLKGGKRAAIQLFNLAAGGAFQFDQSGGSGAVRFEPEPGQLLRFVEKADDPFFFGEPLQHPVNGRAADFFAVREERFMKRLDVERPFRMSREKIQDDGPLFGSVG